MVSADHGCETVSACQGAWETLRILTIYGCERDGILSLFPKVGGTHKIYLCRSYSFPLHHLCASSKVSWALGKEAMHIPAKVSPETLRQMCLLVSSPHCQLECTPPGGRFQEASFSAGVPVNQGCRQNWIEDNFLISTVKSDCLDSTCYWVQFEDRVENFTVAFMKKNRLPLLWCQYIYI